MSDTIFHSFDSNLNDFKNNTHETDDYKKKRLQKSLLEVN